MAPFSYVITPEDMQGWSKERFKVMREWAIRNNLNPPDISVAHPIVIEYVDRQDVIRYHRIVRDALGHVVYDKATNKVATHVQLVPLVVPLP